MASMGVEIADEKRRKVDREGVRVKVRGERKEKERKGEREKWKMN